MKFIITHNYEPFDDKAEISRLNKSFRDDRDLRDLLISIVDHFCAKRFDMCYHLCEILEGHSDNNPLEYLDCTIYKYLFCHPGNFTIIGT